MKKYQFVIYFSNNLNDDDERKNPFQWEGFFVICIGLLAFTITYILSHILYYHRHRMASSSMFKS